MFEELPCPSCGKTNDVRVLDEQHLFDTGSLIQCDHCELFFEVVAIRVVPVAAVRVAPKSPGIVRRAARTHGHQPRPNAPVAPRQPGLMGSLTRLLGGPRKR